MADTKTSALTALTTCDISNDYLPILDVSGSELKRITPENMLESDVGTWTGVISDGTTAATMDFGTGRYEKIGRQVSVRMYIRTTSVAALSGFLRITGLPFISGSIATSITAGYGTNLSITAGQNLGGYTKPGTDYIVMTVWSASSGVISMTPAEWTANGTMMFTVTYNV